VYAAEGINSPLSYEPRVTGVDSAMGPIWGQR